MVAPRLANVGAEPPRSGRLQRPVGRFWFLDVRSRVTKRILQARRVLLSIERKWADMSKRVPVCHRFVVVILESEIAPNVRPSNSLNFSRDGAARDIATFRANENALPDIRKIRSFDEQQPVNADLIVFRKGQ